METLSRKCASCGTIVDFANKGNEATEADCPKCKSRLRTREGDSEMAIPVGMDLPEEFTPADLTKIAHSVKLPQPPPDKKEEEKQPPNQELLQAVRQLSDLLEKWLHTNEGQENFVLTPKLEELTEPDQKEEEEDSKKEEEEEENNWLPKKNSGYKNTIKSVSPLTSGVLVRREAAKKTHQYHREKTADSLERPMVRKRRKSSRSGKNSSSNRKYSLIIIMLGSAVIAGLIVTLIILLTKSDTKPESSADIEAEQIISPLSETEVKQLARESLENFLSAKNLEEAKSYIYKANQAKDLLKKYYTPIKNPSEYTIRFKSLNKTSDGRAAIAFLIKPPQQKARLVLSLQEGRQCFILWEFFAEVGDMTLQNFVKDKSKKPVNLRVLMKPAPTIYTKSLNPEEWESWTASNWEQTHKVQVYVKRKSPQAHKLNNAMVHSKIKHMGKDVIMAQAELLYLGSEIIPNTGFAYVTRLNEITYGSWLPKDYGFGDTFYGN